MKKVPINVLDMPSWYIDHDGYSYHYRNLFVLENGREPRYLPTGKYTDDGVRLWAKSPFV